MIGGCSGSSQPRTPRPKYGDHTTSFGLWDEKRRIGCIIDNGTGVQLTSRAMLEANINEFSVIQSHFHDDHVNGLWLNETLLIPGLVRTIYAPKLGEDSMEDVMEARAKFSNWPVSPKSRGISHHVETFRTGDPLTLVGVRVSTFLLNHLGGAVAFRFHGVMSSGGDLVIASDNELSDTNDDGYLQRFAEFVDGAELVLADAQYCTLEYEGVIAIGRVGKKEPRRNRGHSTPLMIAETLKLCKRRPRDIILVHHDPERDDDGLDRFYKDARDTLQNSTMGYCGQIIKL